MKVNFVSGKLKLKGSKVNDMLLGKKIKRENIQTKLATLDNFKKEEDNTKGVINENREKESNNEKEKEKEEQVITNEKDEEVPLEGKRSNKNEFNTDYMTQAEKLFYEKKMKRLPEKIKKMAKTTFKEKYQIYYKSLTKLPEHNDIPKVGPG